MDPVSDRHKSVSQVLSANRQFARSTASAFTKLLTPRLAEGQTLPDLVNLQDLLAGTHEDSWHQLVTADEACDDARAHRHGLIAVRDHEVNALYRELVDLRLILRGRFGSEPAKRWIGLRGDTSRDPIVLLRQADRAVARLRNLDRSMPPSKLSTSNATRNRWAIPIAEAADRLRATVARVATAVKVLDAARLERQRALEDFNEDFVGIAGWFEATYRLTRRADRAEGVRPSRRHPGKTFLEVKLAAKKAPEREPNAKPSVATRLIASIRQIFDRRRSA